MRLLADEGRLGARIGAGESAGVGLSGCMAAAADPRARRTLRLDGASRVLVFGAEGANDPAITATLLGRSAAPRSSAR